MTRMRGHALRRFRISRSRGDGGAVTAEAALVLPAMVLVVLAALGLAAAGAQRVACTDAAGTAARALVRGDGVARATALALAAAPGASVRTESLGDEVVVVVRRRLLGPGLLRGLPLTVEARAVGLAEGAAAP